MSHRWSSERRDEDGYDTILNGTVNPVSTDGVDGDFFLQTTTHELWGPKSNGLWPGSGVSLVGPTGATGATGATGPAGPNITTTPLTLGDTPTLSFHGPVWFSVTVQYSDFTAASLLDSATLIVLPAKGVIHAVGAKEINVWTGNSKSFQVPAISVGISSSHGKYMSVYNGLSGVVGDTNFQMDFLPGMEGTSASHNITVYASLTNGTWSMGTAGKATIWLLMSVFT